MRSVLDVKQKKTNLFITDEEAFILWKESDYYPKLRIMLGFALFRGLRIGEIRAINIKDFKNPDFNKIDVVLQKSNIKDEFPIIQDFAVYLKKYILENIHLFRDGYLFPGNFGKDKCPYMTKKSCNTMFYKFRNRLIKKYSDFADVIKYKNPKKLTSYNRHRIGWHSCRRWFETKLWENGLSIEAISHVMRYKDPKTVYTYIDCYKTWKEEHKIINDTFGNLFSDMLGFEKGQTKLSEF